MLCVGRELYLEGKVIFCGECFWSGFHAYLRTGLIKLSGSKIHTVVYRCPECGGFDLRQRGKLLNFQAKHPSANLEDANPIDSSPPDQDHNGNTEKRDSR